MGNLIVGARAKEASIEAVVIRVNGDIENLGTICYYHRNPLRRLAWRLAAIMKRK
jgi:hypothetical protein